jgi:hypothetical protein
MEGKVRSVQNTNSIKEILRVNVQDYGICIVIVCEFAVAVRALGFQSRVAERMGVERRIGESESHHHTAF